MASPRACGQVPRRATSTRGRPVRSGLTKASSNPAEYAKLHRRPVLVGGDLGH